MAVQRVDHSISMIVLLSHLKIQKLLQYLCTVHSTDGSYFHYYVVCCSLRTSQYSSRTATLRTQYFQRVFRTYARTRVTKIFLRTVL
jgi:hypothetical protein